MREPSHKRGPRRREAAARLILPWCLAALVAGCGGDPSGPGPGPGPDPDGDATLIITRLVPADSLAFHDASPDWTEGDAWILATAAPGSILWKTAADGSGEPIAVTNPRGFQWVNAAYAPFGIYGGDIGYFQGLLLGDFGMHLMRAGADQVEGEPPAAVLRRFSGTSVGLPPNQISSPRALSVSADGRRAVGTWLATWFMDWQDGGDEPTLVVSPATGLGAASDFRVDRAGRRLAFVGGDGLVYWMLFGGDEAFRIAPGLHPSFSGDGSRLGFRSNNGFDYILLDLATGTSRVYVGGDGVALLHPVLSWAGDRIAFLTRDEAGLGLAVAELR